MCIIKKGLLAIAFTLFAVIVCAQEDTLTSPGAFQLGEVTIKAVPDKEIIDAKSIRAYNALDLGRALNAFPSVVFTTGGSRNENTVYLRGFDIRSVPVYLDGIPVSVPYDGYIDLARFTTYDISKIEISKGFTSMIYGNNTLGGTINLIGMKPSGRFEMNAGISALSGRGYDASFNAGGTIDKFYLQAGFSLLSRDYLPLAAGFDTLSLEKNRKRDNSERRDAKASIKIGFISNKTDEYSISYIYTEGSKGNPIYLGADENVRVRYWKWPYWDKQSLYFISNTALTERTQLKSRMFYDLFRNKLSSFDDNTYSTQERRSSFNSFYEDYTLGGNLELAHDFTPRNNFRLSLQLKNESHKEHNSGEPVRQFADNTVFFGMENVFHAGSKLKLVPGAGFNFRKSIKAEDFNADDMTVTDLPLETSHAFNAQLASYYSINNAANINLNMAFKSRFPTMKDRYSYRLGTSLSNPGLKSEYALNIELAMGLTFIDKLQIRPEIFYSRLSNTIQMVDNVQGDLTQLQNTGTSYFAGGDISVIYTPAKTIRFNTVYSFIRRKNLSNPDILFTDVPDHKMLLGATWSLRSILTLHINGEYNSRRINSSDGIRNSPSFFITNSNLSVIPFTGTDLLIGMNNMFDNSYTIEEGFPEAGRNFYISLHYRFHKE